MRRLISVLSVSLVSIAFAGADPKGLSPLPDGGFTYAVIPDTQRYAGAGAYVRKGEPPQTGPTTNVPFASRISWLAANITNQNIVFVTHVGDIVDKNNDLQWSFASNLMARLDGRVPYDICPGNHDMYESSGDTRLFSRYFPVARFERQGGYAGHFPGVKASKGFLKCADSANSCRLFEAGGMKFVVLHVECNAPEPVMAWVDEMLERHADRHAIFATHAYLGPLTAELRKTRPKIAAAEQRKLGRPVNPYSPEMLGRMRWVSAHRDDGDGLSGEEMWQRHLSKHRNLFLVVCGDQSGVLAYRQESVGRHGNVVSEIMQDYPRSGDECDWIRLFRFLPRERRIVVQTYSPCADDLPDSVGFKTARDDHQFEIPFPPPIAPWTPDAVNALARKVADSYLTRRPPYSSREEGTDELWWDWATLWHGLTALALAQEDSHFRDVMVEFGERHGWGMMADPRGTLTHVADEHCIGQSYLELAMAENRPDYAAKIIALLERAAFKEPATNDPMAWGDGKYRRWKWCDALYMSPTVFNRIAGFTGEPRWREFADAEFKATADYLFDPETHLVFRDSRFFEKRGPTGKKVFWSRGNGWVLAALAIILRDTPPDSPMRTYYIGRFRELAAAIRELQTPDGTWHADLLDPHAAGADMPEVSGTSLFMFGFLWGMNNGLLPEHEYEPVVRRAWEAVCSAISENGALGFVQRTDVGPFATTSAQEAPYGVGAFLEASVELKTYLVRQTHPDARIIVRRNQDSRFVPCESVRTDLSGTPLGRRPLRVYDLRNGRYLPYRLEDGSKGMQTPGERLVFETYLPAGCERRFLVFPAEAKLEPHPRMFGTADDFRRLKAAAGREGFLRDAIQRVCREADEILGTKPVCRQMIGERLLKTSREALRRIAVLSMASRVSGRRAYLERVSAELEAICAFPDWNPDHFLDVGEMTLAAAIAFDWLYDDLDRELRNRVAEAIREKGLRAKTLHHWRRDTNNWAMVCHGGLIAGALAIAGETSEDCPDAIVADALVPVPLAMSGYAPHGAWIEGFTYWSYATEFAAVLMDVLEHCYGTDFGLGWSRGFPETGAFPDLLTGHDSRVFAYSDCGERRHLSVAKWYLARRFNRPDFIGEDGRLARRLVSKPANGGSHAPRLFPLMLLWALDAPAEQAFKPPAVWCSGGENPIVVQRSGDREANSYFIGFKAGTPSMPHGHMDIGAFTLDAFGRRWARDLGAEDYTRIEGLGMGLWDMRQDSERWSIYRLGIDGHNVVKIGECGQWVKGRAHVMSATAEEIVLDLSELYTNATRVVRTGRLVPGGGYEIRDELEGVAKGTSVRWAFHTDAEIASAEGNEAVIRLKNREMSVTQCGAKGLWCAVKRPHPHDWDSPVSSTRLEYVVTAGADGRVGLVTRFVCRNSGTGE